MAVRLEDCYSDECGILIHDRQPVCPDCGNLLRAPRPRRTKSERAEPDDLPQEPDRSFESRLADGFSMLNWG
jgi:hypothetical protein